MFSVFPVPRAEWKQENMRYLLAQLPLVGTVIGFFLWLWTRFCLWIGFGLVLLSAGLTLLPVLFSGAIHMDGFCDTVDALASHADMEKKRAILKDSHTGAFAVIGTVVCLGAMFAFTYELVSPGYGYSGPEKATVDFLLAERAGIVLGLIQILSRAIGGFAGTVFPKSGETGLLAAFHDAAKKGSAAVLIVWMLLCCAAAATGSFLLAGVFAALSAACLFLLYRMAEKQFGGMSGDLAGFLITVSQLALTAAAAVVFHLI